MIRKHFAVVATLAAFARVRRARAERRRARSHQTARTRHELQVQSPRRRNAASSPNGVGTAGRRAPRAAARAHHARDRRRIAARSSQPGLAGFTARMLTEGAGTRDANALQSELAFLGAQLNAGASAEQFAVQLERRQALARRRARSHGRRRAAPDVPLGQREAAARSAPAVDPAAPRPAHAGRRARVQSARVPRRPSVSQCGRRRLRIDRRARLRARAQLLRARVRARAREVRRGRRCHRARDARAARTRASAHGRRRPTRSRFRKSR